MTNLYTSELLTVSTDPVEVLIDRIDIGVNMNLEVSRFSAQDELVGVINPPTTYVENCVDTKTRIRVFLSEGQVAAGEKIQVKLDTI